MTHVDFIGSASGWGAQIRATELGPDAVKSSRILDSLPYPWVWKETFYPEKKAKDINLPNGDPTLPFITDVCKHISAAVQQSLTDKAFPVVIGGDHSVAVGTWGGVTTKINAFQRFGLMWIDAHMDSHTPETTPSHAYHGMPLAALLGFGNHSFVNLSQHSPVLSPEHVCLIGVRSYEEGEAALLQRLGVRVFYMDEVQSRGFKTILEEAHRIISSGTEGFGVSIDLDAFDPHDAPGVGSPEPYGLSAEEVLPTLSIIKEDPHFKALEIVEYNPMLDKESKTQLLIRDLLLNLLPERRK
jgi:arginase